MDQYSGVQDYDAYYVLKIKIAEYRSTKNLQGMTQEAVDHIATMQSIEQNILEYSFQYKHAQNTQQGLSEMCYTVFLTTVSTLITVGLTYGIGKILTPKTGFVWDGSAFVFQDNLIMSFGQQTLVSTLVGAAGQSTYLTIALSPIKESFQEIFVDPYIEAIVSYIVAGLGGSVALQVLLSSFVEGGRETISGPLSNFLFGGESQTPTQNQVDLLELGRYDPNERQKELQELYPTWELYQEYELKTFYGNTESVHTSDWSSPRKRSLREVALFATQGFVSEGVEYVFDAFTGNFYRKDLRFDSGRTAWEIHHIDFIKTNNDINNLLWVLKMRDPVTGVSSHLTNIDDLENRKEYITMGRIVKSALRHGQAPKSWSLTNQMRYYLEMRDFFKRFL